MHGSVAAGAACATCGALPGDPLELDRAVEEHAEPAAIARTGRVITRLGIFIGPGESQGDAMRISTRWTLVLTLGRTAIVNAEVPVQHIRWETWDILHRHSVRRAAPSTMRK